MAFVNIWSQSQELSGSHEHDRVFRQPLADSSQVNSEARLSQLRQPLSTLPLLENCTVEFSDKKDDIEEVNAEPIPYIERDESETSDTTVIVEMEMGDSNSDDIEEVELPQSQSAPQPVCGSQVALSETQSFGDDAEAELVLASNCVSDIQTAKLSQIPGAVFNFTNTIVGAGIVGIPYALRRAGFWAGIALLCAAAALVNYGVISMVECGKRAHRLDYESLVEYVLGTRGFYVTASLTTVLTFGACVSYVVAIGDSTTQMTDAWWGDGHSVLGERWFLTFLFCTVFILPLSLLKNMSSLEFSSTLSILAALIIALCVCVQSPKEDVGARHSLESVSFVKPTLFSAMGNILCALVCHPSAFLVYSSLQNPTAVRFKRTTNATILSALLLYSVPAVIGFLAFRSETEGNILNNFGEFNAAIYSARVLLALTMIFSFPMPLFVCRHSLLNLMQATGVIQGRSDRLFYAVTVALWLLIVAIGASISSLGPVLELTGAVSAAPIGFILPGIVIYKVKGDRVLPFILIVIGMAVFVIGTVTVFVG